MDLLAGIPSVVFGLWGILVLAPNMKGIYDCDLACGGSDPGSDVGVQRLADRSLVLHRWDSSWP